MYFKRCFGVLGVGALCVILSACKSLDDSSVKGHFEDFSEAELKAYKGKLQIIPEHAESTGVIASFSIIKNYGLGPLFENFVAHPDKPKIMVAVSENELPEAQKYLSSLLGQDSAKNDRISFIVVPAGDEAFNPDFSWARDWGPWAVSYKNGADAHALRLIDLNYFSDQRVRADAIPKIVSAQLNVKRVSLPIHTEGGNFMANGRGDCVITEETARKESEIKLLKQRRDVGRSKFNDWYNALSNSERDDPEVRGHIESKERNLAHLDRLVSGSTSYSQQEIEQMYRDYLGCKNVYTLKSNPADYNGHVDLFAKFINDDTIIVAELEEETIGLAKKSMNKDQYEAAYLRFLENVKSHLNTAAKELTAKNFKVVRVPLPLPYSTYWTSEGGEGPLDEGEAAAEPVFDARESGAAGQLHMRSYVNSLILNKKVYVPRFKSPKVKDVEGPMVYTFSADYKNQYVDASLLANYEAKVKDAYGKAGLEVVFIDADSTPYASGSIHCLTMQLGKVQ